MVKSFLFISTFFFAMVLCAQMEPNNAKTYDAFKVIPKEKAYVHHNTNFLFSGEKLQYKVYFLDAKTKKLSKISKIGYVTLIGENGNQIFHHKVILKNGTGYGDFFLPSSLPTGNYKLLGYSQWMKNQGIESFFQSDIQIINPYLPLPKDNIDISNDSILSAENKIVTSHLKNQKKEVHSENAAIYIDQVNTSKRQKLSLKIVPETVNIEKGEYSISIRKVDNIKFLNQVTVEEFNQSLTQTQPIYYNGASIKWIPELRGELISGKVVDQENKNPVRGEKVILSLPGSNYLFQVATTNKNGSFYFNIDKLYTNLQGNLQIGATKNQNLEIIVDKHKLNTAGLEFTDFQVSQELENYIKERSLHNQIENAFIEVKSDSIIPEQLWSSFYRDLETTYQLDDYTRFNTIAETIVEVVNTVSLKTLKNGKRVFQVRPEEGFNALSGIPLVFMDGLYIKNHEDILEYSAKNIKSIGFSTKKYLLGTETYQGILHFETLKQDFVESFYNPDLKTISLFRPQPEKIYHKQSYESSLKVSNRIPDFRRQLLWNPILNLTNDKEIQFYSSDISGEYEIVFEGFTASGRPVSIRKFFSVN